MTDQPGRTHRARFHSLIVSGLGLNIFSPNNCYNAGHHHLGKGDVVVQLEQQPGNRGLRSFKVNLDERNSAATASTTPTAVLTATPQQHRVPEQDGQILVIMHMFMPQDRNNTPEEATFTAMKRQRGLITAEEATVAETGRQRALTQDRPQQRAALSKRTSHRQQPEHHRRKLEYLYQGQERHQALTNPRQGLDRHHQGLERLLQSLQHHHQRLEHYRKRREGYHHQVPHFLFLPGSHLLLRLGSNRMYRITRPPAGDSTQVSGRPSTARTPREYVAPAACEPCLTHASKRVERNTKANRHLKMDQTHMITETEPYPGARFADSTQDDR